MPFLYWQRANTVDLTQPKHTLTDWRLAGMHASCIVFSSSDTARYRRTTIEHNFQRLSNKPRPFEQSHIWGGSRARNLTFNVVYLCWFFAEDIMYLPSLAKYYLSIQSYISWGIEQGNHFIQLWMPHLHAAKLQEKWPNAPRWYVLGIICIMYRKYWFM